MINRVGNKGVLFITNVCESHTHTDILQYVPCPRHDLIQVFVNKLYISVTMIMNPGRLTGLIHRDGVA